MSEGWASGEASVEPSGCGGVDNSEGIVCEYGSEYGVCADGVSGRVGIDDGAYSANK